jgi:Sushi repeat (SCR repeat)
MSNFDTIILKNCYLHKILHSFVNQGENKMGIFIALAVLVCRWLMVCGIGRCPFPGITAHAGFGKSSINWQNRRSFQEDDVVEYKCPGYWQRLSDIKYDLTCRSDGTWNNPLPLCGNEYILILKLRITSAI